MMIEVLKLEKIIINKKGFVGEASIKFDNFTINKMIIDLSNTTNPISIPKFDGVQILSGNIINNLKATILEYFQETLEDQEGLFEFKYSDEVEVNQIN
jgi:hypothetical protein